MCKGIYDHKAKLELHPVSMVSCTLTNMLSIYTTKIFFQLVHDLKFWPNHTVLTIHKMGNNVIMSHPTHLHNFIIIIITVNQRALIETCKTS